MAGSCVVKGVSLLRSGCCSALTTLNSVSGDVTNRCPEFVVKACLQGRLCDAFTNPPHLFPPEAGSISSFFKKQNQKKTGSLFFFLVKEFAQVQKFFDSAFLFTALPCLLCYRKSTVSSRLFIPLSLSLFLRLHHCILTAGT